MLDRETCERLKDAGFPQNEQCACFYYRDCTYVIGSGGHDRREWFSACECPNSDELIAYIREQWPGHRFDCVFGNTTGAVYIRPFPTRATAMIIEDTLAAALAELVITLHKEME